MKIGGRSANVIYKCDSSIILMQEDCGSRESGCSGRRRLDCVVLAQKQPCLDNRATESCKGPGWLQWPRSGYRRSNALTSLVIAHVE